jgi:hypothetical protein
MFTYPTTFPSTLKKRKGKLLMRMFWSIFFLGSMLLVGLDVRERRQTPQSSPSSPIAEGDAMGWPTPD